jgi:tripeptide aminopeptidase
MADDREVGVWREGRTPPAGLAEHAASLADEPGLRRSFRFFHEERKWIDERHLEICRVPALTFCEQQRAEFMAAVWSSLGLHPHIDDAGNLVAPIVYSSSLPFTAISAHLDTTLAPRQPNDVSVTPDGGLRGPGVTDNGAGLAALTALARTLGQEPLLQNPRRNVLLVANVAEEGEGNLHGMKYLCLHSPWASRISEYVVLDGAALTHITVEALGSRRFEVVMEGRGGHSWNDFGRANPVHAMARAVSLLSDIELPRAPRATLTVAMIEGGSGVNSIAASARAKVDIRSRSAAAIDQVVHAMEEAVRAAVESENRRASDRLTGYRIREIGHRPAAARLADNPLADCMRAVDGYLGIRSRLDCASTDANVPLAAGLPALAIGAGGKGGDAHAPTEWYHPAGRALGLQRVALAMSLVQSL